MPQDHSAHTIKSMSYELFILALSLLSLLNLVVTLIPRIDPTVREVVLIMDDFITVVFVVDFVSRLVSAESKRHYLMKDWGWADLLASLPFYQVKIFRLFRILKVVHLSRIFGWHNILHEVRTNRAQSALYLVIVMVILVLEFGGGGIVYAEANNANANIQTAADGIWWSFVSITTVGYGDRYPVTPLGRMVGMITMVLGVGLFGVLTGFLASVFVPGGQADAGDVLVDETEEQTAEQTEVSTVEQTVELLREINRLREGQERLEKQIATQQAAIETQLAQLADTLTDQHR